MNKYKQTFTMFHGNQVRDFLEHNSQLIQYEIGEAPEDYILNVNEEEYVVTPWNWTPGKVKARRYTRTKKGVHDDTTTNIYSRI